MAAYGPPHALVPQMQIAIKRPPDMSDSFMSISTLEVDGMTSVLTKVTGGVQGNNEGLEAPNAHTECQTNEEGSSGGRRENIAVVNDSPNRMKR